MISIHAEVFDRLTQQLVSAFSNVKTSSVYTNSPSSYPFVSIEQIGSSVYEQGSDCCEIENFANIAFEINCMAQGETRMSECYELLEVADSFMKSIGFIRESSTPMQDQNETTYRIISRYSAVVGKDHKTYRR